MPGGHSASQLANGPGIVLVDGSGDLQTNQSMHLTGPEPWADVTHPHWGVVRGSAAAAAANTAAFQSAITAVENAGGGIIFCPKGDYYFAGTGATWSDAGAAISGSLRWCLLFGSQAASGNPLTKDITIVAMPGTRFILNDGQGANTALVLVAGNSVTRKTGKTEIWNVTFDGNGLNQHSFYTDFSLVHSMYADHPRFRHCVFQGWSFAASQIMRDTRDFSFEYCSFIQTNLKRESGTVTSVVNTGNAVVTDTNADWSAWVSAGRTFAGLKVAITGGAGAGKSYQITTSGVNTFTISGTFSPAVDATSTYEVVTATTALRIEVHGGYVGHCDFIGWTSQNGTAGCSNLQFGTNADWLLQGQKMTVEYCEFHGSGGGVSVALGGVRGVAFRHNLVRDAIDVNGSGLQMAHYINTGGYIYDTEECEVTDNVFINCRSYIQLNAGTGSVSGVNWSGGCKRNKVSRNVLSTSVNALKTQMVSPFNTYPSLFPRVLDPQNIANASAQYFVQEQAGIGNNENDLSDNLIVNTIGSGTWTAIELGSNTSKAKGNRIYAINMNKGPAGTTSSGINNPVGADTEDNVFYISGGIGTGGGGTNAGVVFRQIGGRALRNKVVNMGTATLVNFLTTDVYARGNYSETLLGTVWDHNSSTGGVLEQNDLVGRNAPPTVSQTALTAPSFTATASSAGSPGLALATYDCAVTSVDWDGHESLAGVVTGVVVGGGNNKINIVITSRANTWKYRYYRRVNGTVPWAYITQSTPTYGSGVTITDQGGFTPGTVTIIANRGTGPVRGNIGYNAVTLQGRTTVADAAYVVLASDSLVSYTSLTAGRAVTLPDPATVPNQIFTIKDEAGTAGTNNLTVTPTAGLIDGAANSIINTNYGRLQVYSNGINYFTQVAQ